MGGLVNQKCCPRSDGLNAADCPCPLIFPGSYFYEKPKMSESGSDAPGYKSFASSNIAEDLSRCKGGQMSAGISQSADSWRQRLKTHHLQHPCQTATWVSAHILYPGQAMARRAWLISPILLMRLIVLFLCLNLFVFLNLSRINNKLKQSPGLLPRGGSMC